MPFTSFLKAYIELGTLYSEVWTDITTDVDTSSSASMKYGRTKVTGGPITATLNMRLSNALGKYTPQRQVLADGVTANPYYPNILPDKRIKVVWLLGTASTYGSGVYGAGVYGGSSTELRRFTGFIDSWVPGLENGVRAYVDLTASDITARLANVTLQSTMIQEITADSPAALWPFTDGSGATAAAEYFGQPPLLPTGVAPVFGGIGPGFGDGSGAQFSAGEAMTGQWNFAGGAMTVEMFVNYDSFPASGSNVLLQDSNFNQYFGINSAGVVFGPMGNTTTSITVGGWHQFVLEITFGSLAFVLYLDGVAISSGAGIGWLTAVAPLFQVGDFPHANTGVFDVNIGYLSFYNSLIGPTRISAHLAASHGYVGDTTDQRIKRMLTFAGLSSAQWNLDAGYALVNSYPQAGKSVLQYCQDMAVTEGGGSVFYATPDGLCRFTNRYYRQATTPTLLVDAQKDLINSSYLPSLDKTNLQNQVIISRAGESGTLTSQIAQITNQYQLASQPLTTYTTTDADALANGQQIVAQNSTPGFRFPQVGVSVLTAVNDLTAQIAAVQIGSRIRLSNIPPGKAPGTQTDVIVEGWTETFTNNTYTVVFDTSPADNPAMAVFDDTIYGRFASGGTCSLTSTITAAATALSVTTAASNPTFTTTSGDYPFKIQIGEEVIQLNTPPSGATSPQSFTGVTRGASGTPAAPQTAGTLLDVWPLPTFTI